MQFNIVEMDGFPHTLFGELTQAFLFCASIALIYLAIRLFICYSRLWQFSQVLGQPGLIQFEAGTCEPAVLSIRRGLKNSRFLTIVEALRQELRNRGLISVISGINQALDLLAMPFKRMAQHLQVLGWVACLISWLGFLGEIRPGFWVLEDFENPKFGALSQWIAEAIPMHIYGLAVGIVCILVSGFARGRLSFIQQKLMNKVISSSKKKAD